MEKASLIALETLHPAIRQKAIDAYNACVKATPVGVHPFITQGYRTFAESRHLYTLGRTVVNPEGKTAKKPMGLIVSDAKEGQSYHNYGLAFDFVLQINGKESWAVDENWKLCVTIFKAHGFYWGGDFTKFKDYPHLEMRFNHHWSYYLDKYNRKDFIPGTQYVNI